MKYYIIKPKSHKIDTKMMIGLSKIDNEAIIVKSIDEADKCILQKGWTKSRSANNEYKYAKNNKLHCNEGYMYRDKYNVHLN